MASKETSSWFAGEEYPDNDVEWVIYLFGFACAIVATYFLLTTSFSEWFRTGVRPRSIELFFVFATISSALPLIFDIGNTRERVARFAPSIIMILFLAFLILYAIVGI